MKILKEHTVIYACRDSKIDEITQIPLQIKNNIFDKLIVYVLRKMKINENGHV